MRVGIAHHVFVICLAAAVCPRPAGAVEPSTLTCAVSALPGLSSQYARAARASDRADFHRVVAAILGVDASSIPDLIAAGALPGVGAPSVGAVACDSNLRLRDRTAWSMAMAGYSAREVADVIAGHLTRQDLDQALARLMAGVPRPAVTSFIESRWTDRKASPAQHVPAPAQVRLERRSRARVDTRRAGPALAVSLDAHLTALAHQHGLAPDLVRAMIDVESGGNARAMSSAGAIGLMQLMPATAAALGVDPWNPADNLRGGIAYFADLLRRFGRDVRLALVAYNAGPQHAQRVRSGQSVAYAETRRYVEAIASRYRIP